jgi:sodium-dependent dicarboxylate transporter 2/3/5
MRKTIGFLLGPLTFILLSQVQLPGLEQKASFVLALAGWMIIWWSFEAVDMAVTALLPPIVFPLMGVFEIKQAPIQVPSYFCFWGGLCWPLRCKSGICTNGFPCTF